MRSKIKIGVAIAVALSVSSSAYADWQYTKWGSSPAQVLAASNGKASELTNEEKVEYADSSKGSTLTPLLKAPYSAGRHEFTAYFYFDKRTKGLAYVNLRKPEPEPAAGLYGALLQKYGKPVMEEENRIRTYAVWHTKRDQITYYLMEGVSEAVSYRPLQTKDNKGL